MLAACQAPPSTSSSTTTTQATPDVEAPVVNPAPIAKPQPQPPPATTPPPPLGSTRVYLAAGERGDQIIRFDEHGAASLPSHTSSAIADLF
jgi:hypothetical protein